jgi:hypothetical protein
MAMLMGKPHPEALQSRVRQCFVIALTHANDEVRWYAAWGIGKHLWAINRELVLRCINALATESSLLQQASDAEVRRPYQDRRQFDNIAAEVCAVVRQGFFEANAFSNDAYEALDTTHWFGAEANCRILAILGQAPNESAATNGFQRLAHTLVAWWDADDDRQKNHQTRRRERNHETESSLTDLLENFLLRTSTKAASNILEPILGAVDRHPKEAHWILLKLIGVEDREPNTPVFWSLWSLFADKVRHAPWLAAIDTRYPTGGEMVSAIFLGSWWKKDARHWRSLEGYADNVHSLFEALPASSTILHDYVEFLYRIGEQSLPKAFAVIANRLSGVDSTHMLKNSDTIYMLEVLLQRYVYGRPLELKRQKELRDAVLLLLDLLVENGSSAAFRMRDDFVTPMSA